MIDHRAGPGITEEFACKLNPNEPLIAPAGKVTEFATQTCAHCSIPQIMNPRRKRPRGHCSKCDAYVCDLCAKIGICRPIAQVIDELLSGKTPVPIFACDLVQRPSSNT